MNTPRHPAPIAVNFHLYKPCNYRCRFCFATFRDIRGQLDLEQSLQLLRVLRDAGCEKLNFAGGEPTLHPHIGPLLAESRRLGLVTSIISNGARLSQLLAAHAADLDWVGLSVDSADESVDITDLPSSLAVTKTASVGSVVEPGADVTYTVGIKNTSPADAVTLDRFGALDLRIETKPDLTPVTDADQGVEQALRETLVAARPDDALLGEEYGGTAVFAGRQWVIDPIDGTKNFVRGVPVWATLIALLEDGVPVVGAQPVGTTTTPASTPAKPPFAAPLPPPFAAPLPAPLPPPWSR